MFGKFKCILFYLFCLEILLTNCIQVPAVVIPVEVDKEDNTTDCEKNKKSEENLCQQAYGNVLLLTSKLRICSY